MEERSRGLRTVHQHGVEGGDAIMVEEGGEVGDEA